MSLPITLVDLPGLTSERVRDWLSSRGHVHSGLPVKNRRLHGCMVARAGKGVLFYDSEDDKAEQRFTLAHEVAHFVLDHLLPRARAVRAFGRSILPVLDGQRAPSPEQAVFSVFERVSLGMNVRLMDRSTSGAICTGKAVEAEQRADRLAFELLAPECSVLPLLQSVPEKDVAAELASRFGLPLREAGSYARLLIARGRTRRPLF
ncbi:ImmA/IrrE family metallo-endopeptidase [Archangium violaceum]|uniref:ImmA/IrrE family metallo-endopeptidase n=1 Tax=Archangium violaceum TaxID=83451 RepID=UPI0037BEFB14